MTSITKKLDKWEKENLITHEQNDKIKEYEHKNKKYTIGDALIILALAIIGGGIITTIAANWDLIPPYIKIITTFIIYGILTIYGIKVLKQNNTKKLDMCLFFIFLMTLATFGLIVQVFHLPPADGLPFFLCIITAPLLLLSSQNIIPLTWSIWFLITLGTKSYFGDFLEELFLTKNTENRFLNSLYVLLFSYMCYMTDQNINKKSKFFSVWKAISELTFYLIGFLSVFLTETFYRYSLPFYKIVFFSVHAYLTFIMGTYFYFRKQNKNMQNFNLFMIALCIFISFQNLFGKLLDRGISLIATGLFLLLLIQTTRKVSQKLSIKKEKNNE